MLYLSDASVQRSNRLRPKGPPRIDPYEASNRYGIRLNKADNKCAVRDGVFVLASPHTRAGNPLLGPCRAVCQGTPCLEGGLHGPQGIGSPNFADFFVRAPKLQVCASTWIPMIWCEGMMLKGRSIYSRNTNICTHWFCSTRPIYGMKQEIACLSRPLVVALWVRTCQTMFALQVGMC